jgi:hypothetical protein
MPHKDAVKTVVLANVVRTADMSQFTRRRLIV